MQNYQFKSIFKNISMNFQYTHYFQTFSLVFLKINIHIHNKFHFKLFPNSLINSFSRYSPVAKPFSCR